MTATCTNLIKSSFSNLTGLHLTHDSWPSAHYMAHRSVKIDFRYSTQVFSVLTKSVQRFLQPNTALPNKCIVYTETRMKGSLFADRFGDYLDSTSGLDTNDILILQGTLAKEQKTKIIELFIEQEYDDGKKTPNILFATSGVGNAGIDSPAVRCVYHLDFPASVVDVCQEKG